MLTSGADVSRFPSRRCRCPCRRRTGLLLQGESRRGTPLINFLHGYLNYHIEHHLFPDLPLRQYELAQSRLKAICEKHGVPYKEESVFKRVRMAVDVMVGKSNLQPMASPTES